MAVKHLQQCLSGMAWQIVKHYGEGDWRELKQDLEIAGWIAYLEDTRDEAKRIMHARDRMWRAYGYWKFGGLSGGKWREQSKQLEDWGEIECVNPSPEELATVREMYKRLESSLIAMKLPGLVETFHAMVEEGRPHLRESTSMFGLKRDQNSYRKKLIQRKAKELWAN